MRNKALLGAILLLVGACASTGATTTTSTAATTVAEATTTTADAAFPVTVTANNGDITIGTRPERIISLSAVATEMLFAVGAGDLVVAVDDQSNYPQEAPVTDLSGFTPNIEAIVSYQPDLVVIAYEPGELISGLEAVGVTVLHLDAAPDIEGVYDQIATLGAATGRIAEADRLVEEMRSELAALVEQVGDRGEGVTFFHEVDATLYTVTSATLFGEIYSMFGMVNIADEAVGEGVVGYPQLSSEYVVAADPDMIFLADSAYGESAETVAARSGWDVMSAVRNGAVFELDSDVASRWGPRIVELARAIGEALLGG